MRRLFKLNTSGFAKATLKANGVLELEMELSDKPIFDKEFQIGLSSDIGPRAAEFLLDDAADMIYREIAAKMLLQTDRDDYKLV